MYWDFPFSQASVAEITMDDITNGLYYKHMTIVNDDSSIVIKWSFKLIDAARGVIYDCHLFIVQPTILTGSASLLAVVADGDPGRPSGAIVVDRRHRRTQMNQDWNVEQGILKEEV
jgi:hypothetical protein